MRICGLIVFLCGAALLSGCHRPLTPVQEGNRDGILLLGNGTEPSEIDPHLTLWDTDAHIVGALFEGLVLLDPVTMQPVPATADSWTVSPDGLVYTFHIRTTARWSNGDPVTAGDFVYAERRVLSPGLGSEQAFLHYAVKNAQAFNEGKLTDFSQVGYAAPDPHTFVITLIHPVPYFLYLVAGDPPIHQATIEKFGAIDERGTRWTLPGNMVGNGPFLLKTWRVNEVLEVAKNPYYWDAANVHLNGIKFFPIESDETEERAFRSGQLHVTATMPLSKINFYRKVYPDYFHNGPLLATYYYEFNVTRPPFDKADVRRALAMAIDREAIVKTVTRGGQIPAYSLTPPHMGAYSVGPTFTEDVAEARRLLAQAGYPDGRGFPKVELIYNTSEGHRVIAEAIQQMWKKNLNIDVSLFNQETKVYMETLKSKNYQVARLGGGGGYFDPDAFLEDFTTSNESNFTGWSNAQYDDLVLKQAPYTLDPTARYALLRKAEQILIGDMPIMPIYYYTRSVLWRPEVKGWYLNLLEDHPYKYVWLDPTAAGPAKLERKQ